VKHSLRSGGGFVEIDHRESPGLSWEDIPLEARLAGMVPVGKGQHFEADAYQCTHCERTIVLTARHEDMPRRGYCPGCHHYICNRCEQFRKMTGSCWSIFRVLDRAYEIATKFIGQPDHPDAKVDIATLREPPTSVAITLTDSWKS
jgi:hypothetical protein